MAIEHAKPGAAINVAPLGPRIGDARSAAIFKSRDLEVIRLVLPAGAALPTHSVPGEITIQCLEGTLAVQLDDDAVLLRTGEMVFLEGGVPHGVRALEACSALVTIALREAGRAS